jgi:hypothetical protein
MRRFNPSHLFFVKKAPFGRVMRMEPKKHKKDIALAGLFDRLRARFQTEGGTV